MCHDGYNVVDFYELNKGIKDPKELFWKAFYFFAEEEYSDCPGINIYSEKFDLEADYSSITSYTIYFDGKEWSGDINK